MELNYTYIYQNTKFWCCKGENSESSVEKPLRVINKQVLQQVARRKFQMSGVFAEIMGKFAAFLSFSKDGFSILFPVGVSYSKVNLISGLCQYRLNVYTLKVPWHRVQSLGLSLTVLISLLEESEVTSNADSIYSFQHSLLSSIQVPCVKLFI